ncbi:hypothetical protein Gotur_027107 [Gossypium turneri]
MCQDTLCVLECTLYARIHFVCQDALRAPICTIRASFLYSSLSDDALRVGKCAHIEVKIKETHKKGARVYLISAPSNARRFIAIEVGMGIRGIRTVAEARCACLVVLSPLVYLHFALHELNDFTPLSGSEKLFIREWNDEVRQLFYSNYGDLPYLLDVKVDKHLFRALAQFWNPAYSCFTFGKVNLVPTIEKYMALLQCLKIQVDRAYSRAVNSLKDLILAHPDTKKREDVFSLSIYGLVVFPKALGHVDEAVTNLFDWRNKRVTPVPTILAETFRSLNAYRKNLQEEDIEWRAPWLLPDEILYRYGDFDWVPLLEIWGVFGYAPLLVLKQYRSRQFIPATQGIAECEILYKGDGYKKKIREMSNVWNQIHRIKRLAVDPMTTSEYNEWWVRRINDNISKQIQGNNQSIEENLWVVSSELEIIRQDFERRNAELEKKIEQMEEDKINLRLDIDVQKLEVEKLRNGKNKAKEDLDSLKINYKKLRLLMRIVGLGKTSEHGVKRFEKKRIRLIDGKGNIKRFKHEIRL